MRVTLPTVYSALHAKPGSSHYLLKHGVAHNNPFNQVYISAASASAATQVTARADEVAALAKEKEAAVTALTKENMDTTAKLNRTKQLLVATLYAAGVVNARSFLGGSPKAGPTRA